MSTAPASPSSASAPSPGSRLGVLLGAALVIALLQWKEPGGLAGGTGGAGATAALRMASDISSASPPSRVVPGAFLASLLDPIKAMSAGRCFLGDPERLVRTPAPSVDCAAYGLKEREGGPRLMVDAFLVNSEYHVLAARMLEIGAVADYLVMVEGSETFTGIPRTQLTYPVLEPCIPSAMRKRVVHGVPERIDAQGPKAAWLREEHVRNHIKPAVEALLERVRAEKSFRGTGPGGELVDDDVLVAVSDGDELPRPLSFQIAKQCTGWREPAGTQLTFFYYNFGWRKTALWGNGPRIFPYPLIKNRNYKPQDAREWVLQSTEPFFIQGGWHLGYFMGPEEIQRKLLSFAHTEFNREPFNTLEWIQDSIRVGRDLFNRGSNEELQEMDCAMDEGADIPQAVKGNRALLEYFCPAAAG
jgi:beta-1,4-mannosyl-glycoprotein beta-1,4-N-acetylglucosaminyltransferase